MKFPGGLCCEGGSGGCSGPISKTIQTKVSSSPAGYAVREALAAAPDPKGTDAKPPAKGAVKVAEGDIRAPPSPEQHQPAGEPTKTISRTASTQPIKDSAQARFIFASRAVLATCNDAALRPTSN